MKTFKITLVALIALFLVTNTYAQTGTKSSAVKMESIKVSGNCGMCKERIEAAAKVDGVTSARWNKDTKMLTLAYNPTVVKSEEVQKKIAAGVTILKSSKPTTRSIPNFPAVVSTGNLKISLLRYLKMYR